MPKLVGQKPHQEEGKGHHHLAFEELYFRAQSLVEMMIAEFAAVSSSTSIHQHSKLMPLLTLLSNLTVGLQTFLKEDVSKVAQRFKNYFTQLLSSKIFNVRKLSAKAHSLFLTPAQIFPTIMERVDEVLSFLEEKKKRIHSENELHGYLLNILFLAERMSQDKVGMNELVLQEIQVVEKLNVLAQAVISSPSSCFVKAVVFELKTLNLTSGIETLNLITCQNPIGCPSFVNGQVKQVVFNVKEIKKTIEFCLLKNKNLDVQISCLKALNVILNQQRDNTIGHFKDLIEVFAVIQEFVILNSIGGELFSLSIENMSQLLNALLKINDVPSEIENVFCPTFLSYSIKHLSAVETSPVVLSSLLPVVCGALSDEAFVDLNTLLLITSLIKSLSDADVDQDRRFCAAKAMFFLVPILNSEKFKGSEAVVNVWEACVTFLQDEVTIVRHEASRFVTYFMSNCPRRVWNPYLSLKCLFGYRLVTRLMTSDQALDILWRQMMIHFSPGSSFERVILNPFNHEVKSIYAEEVVVSRLAYKCILCLLKLHKNDLQNQAKQLCVSSKCAKECSHKTLQYIQEIEIMLQEMNSSSSDS